MNNQDKGWNPYLAGALSGVVLVLSVLVAKQYFGSSTSFVRTAGLVESVFAPEHVSKIAYFKAIVPKIDWQWMFVVGILLGSFISAITSGSFRLKATPDMWQERFGNKIALRSILAFTGGAIALFGARIAGGCPSGHGLSGLAQISVAGLVALMFFFTGGVVVANILYRGAGK